MCKRNGETPIFLGPIFIHGHSDTMTYSVFFSHLAFLLADCDVSQLIIGSDDEKSMRKSLMQAFPRLTAVVGSRHLHENTKHYLINKVSATSHDRKVLKNAIFRADGITSCTDVVTFEEAGSRFDECLLSSASDVSKTYFTNRLLSFTS